MMGERRAGTTPRPGRHVHVAAVLVASLLWNGCVTTGYKPARRDTPPPVIADVAFEEGNLRGTLVTLITYNGPGSWKRNALWDEYVVTLENRGSEPVTVTGATLIGQDGTVHAPGVAPWALEKLSRTLEQKYRQAGLAFVRYTTPGVVILGSGIAVIAGNGVFSSAAGAAVVGTLVVLPVYYVSVLVLNHRNKSAMTREFERRRIHFPLDLPPGEPHTASLFFPMVPAPRALAIQWSDAGGSHETVLPLDFLSDLHLAPTGQ